MSPRFPTRDVDLLLRRADLCRAKEALGAAGFLHRQVASLGRAGHMEVFLDEPGAKVRDALYIIWAGEPAPLAARLHYLIEHPE